MSIAFDCPCGRRLKVQDDQACQTVLCPACGQKVSVPAEAESGFSAMRADEDWPRPAWASAGRSSAFARRRDEDDDRPRRRRFEIDEDDDDRPSRRPAEQTSGKAVVALVLGILGLMCLALTGLPAVVIGALGLRDIRQSRGRLGGKGMAIAGLVLGAVSTLLTLALIPVGLWMKRTAGEAWSGVENRRSQLQATNNLKQIGIAMHTHLDLSGGQIPPRGALPSKDGRPLLSWRVALLPYLGYDGLYRQFHLDEPWDSPHNRTLVGQMPPFFAHPGADPSVAAQGMTYFRAVTGPRSAFEPRGGKPARFPNDISDGTSNTILAAEASEPVVWTKPDELDYRPGAPLPRLGILPGKPFLVLMWDGSVRTVTSRVSPTTLQAAMIADDGGILGPDW